MKVHAQNKLNFKPHLASLPRHQISTPSKKIIRVTAAVYNLNLLWSITVSGVFSTLRYPSRPEPAPTLNIRKPRRFVRHTIMKLLTLNFLTCAIKACKTNSSSFPLHPRDAELEIVESDINLVFLKNILPRLMWDELRTITSEVSVPNMALEGYANDGKARITGPSNDATRSQCARRTKAWRRGEHSGSKCGDE